MTEDLLPSVAQGDPRAIEECLDRYEGLVWALARRYFRHTADAEDAVQEAFVSLWENAHRFNPAIAPEQAFVTMICRRRIIDAVRRAAKNSGDEPSDAVEEAADKRGAPVRHDGVDLAPFELAEEVARVRQMMDRLKEEERRVLDLAICQGHSQSQVARLTGWPLGTVKSHARRGLQKLRDLLRAQSHDTTFASVGEVAR